MDSLLSMTILLLAGLHLSSGSPTPNEVHQFVPLRKYFVLFQGAVLSFSFNTYIRRTHGCDKLKSENY